ncbi:MAG TPA: hypothetical protein VK728_02705 [Candidatus Sulfotelmatobacter sp.]|nr:hypothetical protein [Candidatus Sulfotelmatobacter sp.]
MSKLHCTSRAEWRLRTGKPAEALSPNYRLDCDFGTPVIVCWEQGGNEPIYVCESHAKQLGRSRDHGPEARVITDAPAQSSTPIKRAASAKIERAARQVTEVPAQNNSPIKHEEPGEIQKVAVVKRNGASSREAARVSAETKIAKVTAEPPVKAPVRDVAYGNSAKAMVDEAIWNLATGDYQAYRAALQQGKSASEAAQAAGGQLEVVHRKISEYTLKLEAVLSETKATINVTEAIDKPLEQAVLEIIGNDVMSDLEKDSAVQQLGELQEWVKQGQKGEISLLQAQRILLAIGERLNWGGTNEVLAEFRPVYRTLFGSLKTAVQTAVPEAQNLHDRLANLYAAKSELENDWMAKI